MPALLQGNAGDADDDYDSDVAFAGSTAGNGHARRHNRTNGNGNGNGNGHGYRPGYPNAAPHSSYSQTDESEMNSSWSVSWLQGQAQADDAEARPHMRSGNGSGDSRNVFTELTPVQSAVASVFAAPASESGSDRLSDISRRLERLERLLATE